MGTKMLGEGTIRKMIKHIEAGTLYKNMFPGDESLLEEFRQVSVTRFSLRMSVNGPGLKYTSL